MGKCVRQSDDLLASDVGARGQGWLCIMFVTDDSWLIFVGKEIDVALSVGFVMLRRFVYASREGC